MAPAFRDVATAREEREKIVNDAQAYAREQIPKAQGEAARIRQKAEGYKEARVAEAQGEMARFTAIAKQYEAAPEITRTRLYLEAMANLLSKMKITVVDEDAGVANLRLLGTPVSLDPDRLKDLVAPEETQKEQRAAREGAGPQQRAPAAQAKPAGREAQ